MRGHTITVCSRWTIGAALAGAALLACGEHGSPTVAELPEAPSPTPTPPPDGVFWDGPRAAPAPVSPDDATCADAAPRPIAPPAGAIVEQGDPRIGCPASATHGYGFRIEFDWSASCAAAGGRYQLWLMQTTNAIIPALDLEVTGSRHDWRCCNCYVIEANRRDWRWRVRAADGAGGWGPWSEERELAFGPCPASVCR